MRMRPVENVLDKIQDDHLAAILDSNMGKYA